MKKQIISLIMVLFFSWSNMLWAKTIPQPTETQPEEQETGPSAPANADALQLTAKPVLNWTDESVLVICTANCEATTATKLYAYNKGAGFPAGTKSWNKKEGAYWFVLYQLPGVNWQRITNSMLGKAPTTGANTAPGDNLHKKQPQKVNYRLWKQKANGKGWEEFNSDNPNFSVLVAPAGVDEKGRVNELVVVVKDLQTGQLIVKAQNVYITHWGKTIRTLGIAAAFTIGFGAAVYYAPGIILAAMPFP